MDEKKLENLIKKSRNKKEDTDTKNSVDNIIKKTNQKIKNKINIGNISSLNKKISDLEKDSSLSGRKIVEKYETKPLLEIQSSIAKIAQKLKETVGFIAEGTKNISIASAKAVHDGIQDYQRVIAEDISVNKQNLLASTLAKASPIFGYFAGKFMESQIFQKAFAKIRLKIVELFSGGWERIRDKVRDLKERKKITKISSSDIPKMQTGGYVKKGGLAKLHPAEVVVPAEKFFKTLDSRFDTEKTKTNVSFFEQLKKYFSPEEKPSNKKTGFIQDFIYGFVEAHRETQKKPMDVTNKTLRALQVTLLGQTSRLREAFHSALIKHPVIRNTLTAVQLFTRAMFAPVKFLFTWRGGYNRYIPRGTNTFSNIAGILVSFFVFSMIKFDRMLLFLQNIAYSIQSTGKRQFGETVDYPPVPGVGRIRRRWMPIVSIGKGVRGLYRLGKRGGAAFMRGIKRVSVAERALKGKETYTTIELLTDIKKYVKKTAHSNEKVKSNLDHMRKKWKSFSDMIFKVFLFAGNVLGKIPFLGPALKNLNLFGRLGKVGRYLGHGLKLLGIVKLLNVLKNLNLASIARGATRFAGPIGAVFASLNIFEDMLEGSLKSRKWFGDQPTTAQSIFSVLAAMVGGTDSGVKGAAKGALKGGAIGMAIGSVVPGIGTIMGGALGAIAGGVMGFVGGENIAKGMSAVWNGVKDIVSSIWDIVTFPFTLLARSWEWIKKQKIIGNLAKTLEDHVKWKIEPFVIGIKKLANIIWDGLDALIEGVLQKLQHVPFIGTKVRRYLEERDSGKIESIKKDQTLTQAEKIQRIQEIENKRSIWRTAQEIEMEAWSPGTMSSGLDISTKKDTTIGKTKAAEGKSWWERTKSFVASGGSAFTGAAESDVSVTKELPSDFISKLKLMIKHHEGLRLQPYLDSVGKPTIGYGHLIKPGENFSGGITLAKAEQIFDEDFRTHYNEAKRIPGFEKLDPVRQGALIDMVFNMGLKGVLNFKNTLSSLTSGDYKGAYKGILGSKYFSQVGLRGRRIAAMLATGEQGLIDSAAAHGQKLMAKHGATIESTGTITANAGEKIISTLPTGDIKTNETQMGSVDKSKIIESEVSKELSSAEYVSARSKEMYDKLSGQINETSISTKNIVSNYMNNTANAVNQTNNSNQGSGRGQDEDPYVRQILMGEV